MNTKKFIRNKDNLLYTLALLTVVICIVIVSILVIHNRIEANINGQISSLQSELQNVQEHNAALEQEHATLQQQHDEVLDKLDALINPVRCEADEILIYDIALDASMQRWTHTMCESYGIGDKYTLVLAIMQVESGYNASAVSSTNDYGLMQINECNHDALRETLSIVDFLDPQQNIEAGVYMISTLLSKYESDEKALMAYNLGEGGAATLWDYGKYSTRYVEEVLAAQKQIESTQITKIE